jgi:hypothetical protein
LKSNSKNLEVIETLLQDYDEEVKVNRLVYKIPKKHLDYIKQKQFKFSQFVNEAIEEKINRLKGIDSGKK